MKTYKIVMSSIAVALLALLIAAYVVNGEVLTALFKMATTGGDDKFDFWGFIRLIVIFPLYSMEYGLSQGETLFGSLVNIFIWGDVKSVAPDIFLGVTYLLTTLFGVVVVLVDICVFSKQWKTASDYEYDLMTVTFGIYSADADADGVETKITTRQDMADNHNFWVNLIVGIILLIMLETFAPAMLVVYCLWNLSLLLPKKRKAMKNKAPKK